MSLLSEAHVKRLRRNGFSALLPGIGSWHDLGNKSNSGARTGGDKLRPVADQANMIRRYVPFGLDCAVSVEGSRISIKKSPGSFL